MLNESNGHGSALERVAKFAPDVMFDTFKRLEATGMLSTIAGLLGKVGIDLSSLIPQNGSSPDLREENKPEVVKTIPAHVHAADSR